VNAATTLLAEARCKNPYATAWQELLPVQLEALSERLAEYREHIAVLDRRAAESEVLSVDALAAAVPLLFSHTTYKSYPESFVRERRWERLNEWLGALSR
jgi:hypothetical protein